MTKKVYGIEIVESWYDEAYDTYLTENIFDTTAVYSSKHKAVARMTELALNDYENFKNFADQNGVATPVINYDLDADIVDVVHGSTLYKSDIIRTYCVAEMNLYEED